MCFRLRRRTHPCATETGLDEIRAADLSKAPQDLTLRKPKEGIRDPDLLAGDQAKQLTEI